MPRAPRAARRLAIEGRFDWPGLMRFLAPRAIPGVEEVADSSYRRTVRSADLVGVLRVRWEGGGALEVTAERVPGAAFDDATRRIARLLDLDTDLQEVARVLGSEPVLEPLVAARPELRAPGAFDGWELAVRAVLGQQVTVAAATTLAGRVVRAVGRALATPSGSLTHAFPTPGELARAELPGIGMPGSRVATLRTLGAAVAERRVVLDGSADPDATREALLAHRPLDGGLRRDARARRSRRVPDRRRRPPPRRRGPRVAVGAQGARGVRRAVATLPHLRRAPPLGLARQRVGRLDEQPFTSRRRCRGGDRRS
jgi:3-methyladenine DNA glycosylase/8-oxoguanine DNA glycosylase